MNTFTTGGKGKKQCKSCGLYVGVRTSTCQCGASFDKTLEPPKKVEVKEVKAAEPVKVAPKRVNPFVSCVTTPGTGMPGQNATPLIPVNLPEELTSESIAEWIRKSQEWAQKHDREFGMSAFKYMAFQKFPDEPDKRDLIWRLIQDYYQPKISEDFDNAEDLIDSLKEPME